MNLSITMIEPDETPAPQPKPITPEELDEALGGGAANEPGPAPASKHLLFTPQQLDHMLDLARQQERHRLLNTPEIKHFVDGVVFEAMHQRSRWGSDHDVGKTPFDWVFLIGHLATRAAVNYMAGNEEKALHHAITTAAAAANWHAAMLGQCDVRPGLPAEKAAQVEP